MPTTIGTINIHIGDGEDAVYALTASELRETAVNALITALSEAKGGHLYALDLGNGTVRLSLGVIPFHVHNAAFIKSERVHGECTACGMDWDEDMDYCTGCESA